MQLKSCIILPEEPFSERSNTLSGRLYKSRIKDFKRQRGHAFVLKLCCLLIVLCNCPLLYAQYNKDVIKSDVVLAQKRQSLNRFLLDQVIKKTFHTPLDSDTQYNYEDACLSASQYMLHSQDVQAGFDTLFIHYDSLDYSVKRSFTEAVYGLYPATYVLQMRQLLRNEKDAKLFSMEALYLYRNDSSKQNVRNILSQLHNNFLVNDTAMQLRRLSNYLTVETNYPSKATPDINKLFAFRKSVDKTTVYSFQRWNRDFPGLAIIQKKDGSFARDSSGKLLVFRQLARSTSALPYFITGGNTPQGIYSIWSTAISYNKIIGPTPNLQTLMPFENDKRYWQDVWDSSKDALRNYLGLLPIEWQNYLPMLEAFTAGQMGRSAIIAHGSTIDPAYFKDQPFYPLSPTMGCLCGQEWWDEISGKIAQSDQLDLVNTFIDDSEEETGWLYVININNDQQAVSRDEVEKMVNAFEELQ